MAYLTKDEITRFYPGGPRSKTPNDLAYALREGIKKANAMTNVQMAGRNFPIACVALEVTQRCNLDCTLCYLSDLAEAVEDVPLFEIKRRIKMIHDHYGDYTNIQITGGDPTLRTTEDLVEIVKEIKSFNMRCALFTNGIKATREMLTALAKVGLDDAVFHVDMTQERKGYESELELNDVRIEYIERARGLGIRTLFNTTIFDDNVNDIPELVRFFVDHAKDVNLASFQMQANTGRGVLRERDEDLITQQRVMNLIREGSGLDELSFDIPMIGHPECNKYTAILTAGNSRCELYDDEKYFGSLFDLIAGTNENWSVEERVFPRIFKECIKRPSFLYQTIRYGLRKFWQLKSGLLRGQKPNRISFFIHNFMDAEKLQKDRCEACVFMVATANGPLSMCVHNAKRDAMISHEVKAGPNQKAWKPLPDQTQAEKLPLKKLKGRIRAHRNEERKKQRKKSAAL